VLAKAEGEKRFGAVTDRLVCRAEKTRGGRMATRLPVPRRWTGCAVVTSDSEPSALPSCQCVTGRTELRVAVFEMDARSMQRAISRATRSIVLQERPRLTPGPTIFRGSMAGRRGRLAYLRAQSRSPVPARGSTSPRDTHPRGVAHDVFIPRVKLVGRRGIARAAGARAGGARFRPRARRAGAKTPGCPAADRPARAFSGAERRTKRAARTGRRGAPRRHCIPRPRGSRRRGRGGTGYARSEAAAPRGDPGPRR
jgi:hypothetical protein